MAILSAVTGLAAHSTVTSSSQVIDIELAPHCYYRFCSTVGCWISQGTTPTASAGDGSMFVPAGDVVTLDGSLGAALAVIRAAGDGECTLCPWRVF